MTTDCHDNPPITTHTHTCSGEAHIQKHACIHVPNDRRKEKKKQFVLLTSWKFN